MGLSYAEETDVVTETEQPNEQQEIHLDMGNTKKKYELGKTQYHKNLEVKSAPQAQPQATDYSKTDPNQKRTVTTDHKKKVKNVSFGSKNTHNVTSDTYSGSSTLYTEYEKKNFKLNSGYSRNTTPNQNNTDKGSLSVTPEYKINKHVSVQNQYSTNLNDNSNKAEVRLNVQPTKDDRMNMGVGVGQKFSGSSAPSSSQVNFSTNFKF